MPVAKFSVPDSVFTAVKRLAASQKISEPDAWRLVVTRGIEAHELSELADGFRDEMRKEMDALRGRLKRELLGDMTRVLVESLCLTRRLAGASDPNLVRQAKEDAQVILNNMGVE